MHLFSKALPLLALAGSVLAQTWSDCDPTKTDGCKPNRALGVENYTIDFTQSMMSSDVWNVTTGKIDYTEEGARFRIGSKGEQPLVRSNFYIFFGQVEVIMKASHGQGIVSSVVLQSDDLDEVDWEWIGGNSTYVQTNYFGKGNTTSFDRDEWHKIDDPNTQESFHNYTLDWSKEKLDFYIDGQLVRTLMYEDANGGKNFPQTPSDVRLGIWPGGDSKSEGTVEWAGGKIDYDQAPFDMVVKSVRVRDATNATEYVWGDRSGSWESIQAKTEAKAIKLDGENGQSTVQSASQRWSGLSSGAKIAIIASVCGVLGIGLAVFIFCCIKQRRIGKHERLVEDAKFEKSQAELMAYRAEMGRQRSEKFGQVQVNAMPMGNMGASIHHPRTPMQGGASPLLGGGYQRY